MIFKRVTVFGGAAKNINPRYNEAAFKLGEIIAKNDLQLVFGIGDNGMMGEVFHGALRECGSIRGITTPKLLALQCENPGLFKEGEIEIVATLSERKFKMFKEGDAIFILPGGWGTLDELAEFSVLIQTGEIKKKPLIFINLYGFWDCFKEQLTRMYTDGTLNQEKINYVYFVNSVEEALPKAEEIYHQLHK